LGQNKGPTMSSRNFTCICFQISLLFKKSIRRSPIS
jgi:hypothetical protein